MKELFQNIITAGGLIFCLTIMIIGAINFIEWLFKDKDSK